MYVCVAASAEASGSVETIDSSEPSDDEGGGGESGDEASSSSGADIESCGNLQFNMY